MRKVLKRFVKRWEKNEINETAGLRDEFNLNQFGGYYIDLTEKDSLPKLHIAIWSGQSENVRKLLKKSDLNAVDSQNRTALHLAVAQCYVEIVQELINNGANTEICDNSGLTPFLKAVEIGNLDLVQIFLNNNINLNVTDNKGNTALHLAVLYGFCNIAALLLHKGIAKNVINESGDTALHIATQNEYLEVVDLLLKNGSDFNVPDSKNKTPFMLAIKSKNIPLLKIFIHYGAHNELTEDSLDPVLSDFIFKYLGSAETDINLRNVRNDMLDTKNIMNDVDSDSARHVSISKDDTSQASLRSCIIPPVLKPVRSWDVIQSNLMQQSSMTHQTITSGMRANDADNLKSFGEVKNNTTSGFSSSMTNEEDSDVIEDTSEHAETAKSIGEKIESNLVTTPDGKPLSANLSSIHFIRCSDHSSVDNRNENITEKKSCSETTVNIVNDKNEQFKKDYDDSGSINDNTPFKKSVLWRHVTSNGRRERCKSLTMPSCSTSTITEINLFNVSKGVKMSSQLKQYDRVLKRLSLDSISIRNDRFNNRELEPKPLIDSCSALFDRITTGDVNENHRMRKVSSESSEEFANNDFIISQADNNVDNRAEENSINVTGLNDDKSSSVRLSKKRKRLFNMNTTNVGKAVFIKTRSDSDDSSSDNDPPFWKSSEHGGYFSRQNAAVNEDGEKDKVVEDDVRKFQSTLGSSSSDEDIQTGLKSSFLFEAHRNKLWEHLKQVTKDKSELEDVTFSLRETTEKLKYDLENSRQIMVDKDDSLATLTKHLFHLDEKYLRTMEQMNEFRYCMKNLEQEVSHLTEICKKANNSNQYLMQQLAGLVDDRKSRNEEKYKLLNQNMTDIQKLQSDVLFWQEKHDILLQKIEKGDIKEFIQQLDADIKQVINEVKILQNKEIGRINSNDQIRSVCEPSSNLDYKSNEQLKEEVAELKCSVDSQIGQITKGIINKSEEKLCTMLTDIKNILINKFEQVHKEELERSNVEARMVREFEISKQKYVLEISRLNSLLKSKEEHERLLKQQYDELCNKIETVKDEKRKHLITKSYSLGVISTVKNSSDRNVKCEKVE